jgi:hypothetical protein
VPVQIGEKFRVLPVKKKYIFNIKPLSHHGGYDYRIEAKYRIYLRCLPEISFLRDI